MENWIDIGSVDELSASSLKRVTAVNREFAVSYKDGTFGVLSNTCNHAGGPLGKGRLDGEYIVCPWHNWKFHRCSGQGEPGFEDDRVPAYPVKVEGGHVFIDLNSATKRHKRPHPPHPLMRKVERAPGPLRLAGVSTTAMDAINPRFSGSDYLLDHAVRAAGELKAETRIIRLNDHCASLRNAEPVRARTIAAIGGRQISLHALRHTHASSLIAAGVDILTVSRRLGHANPTITLGVYGHLYGNTDDRAAQAIDAMLSRTRTE
jgi:nitrite reductase/ring-hydroxylating ferredoxin subunit